MLICKLKCSWLILLNVFKYIIVFLFFIFWRLMFHKRWKSKRWSTRATASNFFQRLNWTLWKRYQLVVANVSCRLPCEIRALKLKFSSSEHLQFSYFSRFFLSTSTKASREPLVYQQTDVRHFYLGNDRLILEPFNSLANPKVKDSSIEV